MNPPRWGAGFWRGYLLGLATLVLAGLLWQAVIQPPAVYAQIPDSGAQRNHMIKEQAVTNQKLTQVVDLLREIRDLNKAESAAKRAGGPSGTRP